MPVCCRFCVSTVQRYNESVNSFVEELVVRRELSDNHCFYNPKYDSIDGASAWARESLLKHATDKVTRAGHTHAQHRCCSLDVGRGSNEHKR